MADLTGRFVRCQIGGPSSTWLPILGERSTRISTERSPIDCTTRTEVWSTAIGGGVGSRSITVGGVARKGAGWSAIMAAQWAGTAVPLRFLDVTDVVYEGSGLVTKMNQDMAHDGAQIFSVEFILGPAIYDGYITSTYTSTWTGSVWGTPVITGSTVVATLPVGINTWTVPDATSTVATGTFTVAVGNGDFNGVIGVAPIADVPALPNLLHGPGCAGRILRVSISGSSIAGVNGTHDLPWLGGYYGRTGPTVSVASCAGAADCLVGPFEYFGVAFSGASTTSYRPAVPVTGGTGLVPRPSVVGGYCEANRVYGADGAEFTILAYL